LFFLISSPIWFWVRKDPSANRRMAERVSPFPFLLLLLLAGAM